VSIDLSLGDLRLPDDTFGDDGHSSTPNVLDQPPAACGRRLH
jgi:hypothetical protein